MKGRAPRNIDATGAEVPLWQRRDPPWVHAILGVAVIALLSWADNAIGTRVSLDYFYILPVIVASWRGNRDVGLFLVFTGGIAWFACEWPFNPKAWTDLPEEFRNSVHLAPFRPDPLFRVWEATMLTGFLAVVCLLTCRLRETFERERSQARTDELTGLANRRTFCERLDHEIERMRRTQRPFTLASIDLDNFKYVNDHFGHLTGDEVLQVIARHMLHQLRVTDLPGRMGGDEFALLLTETDASGARTCLMELLAELDRAVEKRGWPVGCSIGAVTFRVAVDSVNDALHLADEQMYAAKRAGKGRLEQVVYYGPSKSEGSPVTEAADEKAPLADATRGAAPVNPSSKKTRLDLPPKPVEKVPVKTRSSAVVVPAKGTAVGPAKTRRDPDDGKDA